VYCGGPSIQWEALKLLRLLTWFRASGPSSTEVPSGGPLFDPMPLFNDPRLSRVGQILGHVKPKSVLVKKHLDNDWFGKPPSNPQHAWQTLGNAPVTPPQDREDQVIQSLRMALEFALGLDLLINPGAPTTWQSGLGTTCPPLRKPAPSGVPIELCPLDLSEQSTSLPIDFWWIHDQSKSTFTVEALKAIGRVAVLFQTPGMS